MHNYRPGALRQRCYIRGCSRTSDQNHHLTYRPYGDWSTIPICALHHEELERLFQQLQDMTPPHGRSNPSRELFTCRYVMDPDVVRLRVETKRRMLMPKATPPPIEARQLSFADLHGPGGDYWRQWQQKWDPQAWAQQLQDQLDVERRRQRKREHPEDEAA